MRTRIIPRLDIKNSSLVKGINLEGLRVLGKPELFAAEYYETGADELFCMDVVASLYQRNSLLPIIEGIAKRAFIPLTVGGGIRTLDDIQSALNAGADKVAINTAAIQRPEFISEAADRFGNSTIVVSIEALLQAGGHYGCFTDNGREPTGVDAYQWAAKAEELGAGELMVTSVDREGTGKGFDMDLMREICARVSIPVIASGGAGSTDHIQEVVEGGANAVALASMVHYSYLEKYREKLGDDYDGNTNFLKSSKGYSKVQALSLATIREQLGGKGIECLVSSFHR